MFGLALGAVGRLAAYGVSGAIDVWKAREQERREQRRFDREQESVRLEQQSTERRAVIVADAEADKAASAEMRERIRDQADLRGTSKWVKNVSKLVRPIIAFGAFFMAEGALAYLVLTGGMQVLDFKEFNEWILGYVLGFYFTDRALRKDRRPPALR